MTNRAWAATILTAVLVWPAVSQDNPLIGLNERELTKLVGTPGLVRRESPAQLWQYDHAPCFMHVFLYAPERGGDAQVAHVEARMNDGSTQRMSVDQVTPCLQQMGVLSLPPVDETAPPSITD